MNDLLIPVVALVFAIAIAYVLFRTMMSAYVKTPTNRAFVRTGGLFGNSNTLPKVVVNGGAWVFRTIHEITWVDLGSMAIEIERTENNALLTRDPQYADIKVIFYIKINPTTEGIIDAARTIGAKIVDSNAVKQLVDAKLDGALRDVAASFTLMSLHQEREKFIQEVQNRLKSDLEENGLMLESVSILTLRAARQGTFGTDDVFGAQVARANAAVIQQAQRERNDIERKTEIEIKQRNTTSAKLGLDLDRDLALNKAAQEREIRTLQATEKAVADQKVYEEEQKSELGRVAKERAIALAEIDRDRDLATQSERKQQEIMTAELARRQAIELAEQQRQIKLLVEQQKRAQSERELLLVNAERVEADQAVKTVEAAAQAKRESQISVIQSERDAQRAMIEQKNKIELESLRKLREAEAQAQALKATSAAQAEAALKQAETLKTQAAAENEAAKLRADGERARASASGLAEAEVQKAKADAAMREAEAIKAHGIAEAESAKAKAEALAAYDGVAQRVEILKLELDAKVRIETAKSQALSNAMASMNIKMIGDPAAAASLLRMMTMTDGLGEVLRSAPQPVREIAQQLVNKATGDPNGDTLLKLGELTSNMGNHNTEELSNLVTQVMGIAEQRLNVNNLKKHSLAEVMAMLDKKATAEDKPILARAQTILATLPMLNDMPFEEIYLRASKQKAHAQAA